MDAILAVRTILLSDTVPGGIVALVGQNVYGGQLPEHYNPEDTQTGDPAGDGPAITLLVKGGTTHAEMPQQDIDVQVVVWSGINQNFAARAIYNRCFQVLHGLCNVHTGGAGIVNRILASTPGSDVVDPDTGWATVVASFTTMLFDDGNYPVDIQVSATQTAAEYADAAIAAIDLVDGDGNFS